MTTDTIRARGLSVHYEGPPRSFRQEYELELQMHKIHAAEAIAEMRRRTSQRDTVSWVCAALAVALIVVALGRIG